MPVSGRTWSQLFLCAVAVAAQIRVFQAARHSAAPSPIDRSSVLGRVVDAGTNKPLRNAVVAIVAPSGDRIDATRTGADGTFAFSRVPIGQWNFEVVTNGYQRLMKHSEEATAGSADTGFILALTKLPGT